MDLNPPEGSKISIVDESGSPVVVIPPAGGFSRYFNGAFLLFWLGMWAIGFHHAISEILAGKAQAFIILWLGAWTLGGIAAANMLYRSIRPSVPETLKLNRSSIGYDSGIAPPQVNWWQRKRTLRDSWSFAFPKRIRLELDRSQLQSLRLRETETGNRLTFDAGSQRIEVAPTASEVEREWLARLLARRYSLSQILAL